MFDGRGGEMQGQFTCNICIFASVFAQTAKRHPARQGEPNEDTNPSPFKKVIDLDA